MSVRLKQLFAIGLCLLVLPALAALVFYHVVVGRDGLTNFWSVFFGWQLLILCGATLGTSIYLMRKKKLRKYLVPFLVVGATILAVIVPSWVSTSSRRYITGEGGPAGPTFSCLLWDKTGIYSTYDAAWGFACGVMSIPSYSKFWIDQRYDADQTDTSSSYYVALAVDEYILLTGVGVSFLLARRVKK